MRMMKLVATILVALCLLCLFVGAACFAIEGSFGRAALVATLMGFVVSACVIWVLVPGSPLLETLYAIGLLAVLYGSIGMGYGLTSGDYLTSAAGLSATIIGLGLTYRFH